MNHSLISMETSPGFKSHANVKKKKKETAVILLKSLAAFPSPLELHYTLMSQ